MFGACSITRAERLKKMTRWFTPRMRRVIIGARSANQYIFWLVNGRSHACIQFFSGHNLRFITQNGIGDFNLAYAYEAIARAYGVSGDFAAAKEYADKALAASENIAQKEDKELVLSDLATIPIKPK